MVDQFHPLEVRGNMTQLVGRVFALVPDRGDWRDHQPTVRALVPRGVQYAIEYRIADLIGGPLHGLDGSLILIGNGSPLRWSPLFLAHGYLLGLAVNTLF
jgi:hypothetical protein